MHNWRGGRILLLGNLSRHLCGALEQLHLFTCEHAGDDSHVKEAQRFLAITARHMKELSSSKWIQLELDVSPINH